MKTGGWIAPPKELIANYNRPVGAGHSRGRLVQTVFVGTCTYRSGCLFEKCKGTALTRSGDTERPVPEASSRPGSTLFVSFIYLFFFQ